MRRPAAVVLAAGILVGLSGCGLMPSMSPVDAVEFEDPLPIPPLADSHVEDGVRVVELTAQEGETEFVEGRPTATRGFDGDFLGPTIRAARGERVAFDIANELTEVTSVHWHGMHLPAAMDGGPHQPIEPGGTWEPTWTIDQPAATLWYHPHPHGTTEQQVYEGLAGLFLIDDERSRAAALPSEYGVDDVPVIVQDRDIDLETGELDHDEIAGGGSEVGLLGNTVMTNGRIGAFHEVTTERVRLRLLNGSTARTYAFGFDDRDMTVVATDGGLLPEPVVQDRLRLSPGERAEVVVAMRPGERAMLRSFAPDLGTVAAGFATGAKDEFDVLELRAADDLAPRPEPAWEYEDVGLEESEAAVTRRFELSGRKINGAEMDMGRIDEVVEVGDTEIWELRNDDLSPHNFHVHDVQFEVLSIDGSAPPEVLSGRKDTIYLEPHREYRVLMRFEDFVDPDMPYMYHCHLILHEDEGLMGQFVVVDPQLD